MLNIQSIVKFPIPQISVEEIPTSEEEINRFVYASYGFTKEEIVFIEKYIS